jgi:GNAT superfamily N-acetyltransferase
VYLTLRDSERLRAALTRSLVLPSGVVAVCRPLSGDDAPALARFLEQLSPVTRELSVFPGYDLKTAEKFCGSIGKHDKLRLVLALPDESRIVAILEFSLSLLEREDEAFADYGVAITEADTLRFGPTISDDYQGRGVGDLLFPSVVAAARCLGRSKIILWGGVFEDNVRAIKYYERHGFRGVGEFVSRNGRSSLDMILDLPDPEVAS